MEIVISFRAINPFTPLHLNETSIGVSYFQNGKHSRQPVTASLKGARQKVSFLSHLGTFAFDVGHKLFTILRHFKLGIYGLVVE